MALRVDLLDLLVHLPNVDEPNSRKALIDITCPPEVRVQLDWRGSNLEFFAQLIDVLAKAGRSQLRIFIAALMTAPQVDVGRREQLAGLLAQLDALDDEQFRAEFPLPKPRTTNTRAVVLALAAILVVVLAIGAYLVYPSVEPLWNPWPMTGDFNIAVADFGLLRPDGSMAGSEFGSSLSASVFTQMVEEYKRVEDLGVFEGNVQIWHDTLGRGDGKNVRFGAVAGSTPEERMRNAAALADRIKADMVVYGYLTPEENAESLSLEFYYATPVRAGEPDATTGAHELGDPLTTTISAERNPGAAKTQLRDPLALRAAAIFWITQGLAYEFANEPERALAVLREAEQQLKDWPRDDGKEVLYLFLARAATWARQFDQAIAAAEEAFAIDDSYASAYGVLGTALMDRAQLYFVRDRELTPEEQVCISQENLEQAASTPEAARADIERAVEVLQQGIHLAPDSYWPPVEHYLRVILGLTYRLQGQERIFAGDWSAAEAALAKAQTEFEDALGYFAVDTYPALYASAEAGLAATQRLQAHLRIVAAAATADEAQKAAQHQEAITLLQAAVDGYQRCLDQRERAAGNAVFQQKVIQCSCVPYAAEAQARLDEERAALDELGGKP